MTYEENDDVTLLKIAIEDPRVDYVILNEPEGDGGGGGGCLPSSSLERGDGSGGNVGGSAWCCLWWWAKLVLVLLFLAVLGVCFFLWIGPFLMNKEVIPILNWETKTFCKPVLAVLIFASVALFPTIFVPSTPSMWVAGMSFGYGYGFLLIIGGVTIGASLPYFLYVQNLGFFFVGVWGGRRCGGVTAVATAGVMVVVVAAGVVRVRGQGFFQV